MVNSFIQEIIIYYTNYSMFDWLKFGLCFLLILIFYVWFFSKFKLLKETGYTKWYRRIMLLFFISLGLGINPLVYMFSLILGIAPMLSFVLYPEETREFIDNKYGRIISKQREKYYLSKTSINEISEAMIDLSNNREGATILIAKSSNLDDVIATGDEIGNLEVKKDVIELLFSKDSAYNKGAMVIRDDKIVAVNCFIENMADSNALRNFSVEGRAKLLSGQLLVSDIVGLSVSGKTGRMSLAGRLGGKPVVDTNRVTQKVNIQHGLDTIKLNIRINSFFTGAGLANIDEDINKNIGLTKEAKAEAIKKKKAEERTKREQEIETKRKEREERRNSRK